MRATGEDAADRLTARERDVLGLMADGHSNLGIADQLGMTVRTVETHTTRIFEKLDLLADPKVHRRVLAVVAHVQSAHTQSAHTQELQSA